MTTDAKPPAAGEHFTGHGPEWRDARLNSDDARVATVWSR